MPTLPHTLPVKETVRGESPVFAVSVSVPEMVAPEQSAAE